MLDSVLREGLRAHGDEFDSRIDPRLSGLPDTAHGGSVLRGLPRSRGRRAPQHASGPIANACTARHPLRLTLAREKHRIACELRDDAGAVLVDGGVGGGGRRAAPRRRPRVTAAIPCPIHVDVPGLRRRQRARPPRAALFDDERVWTRWAPRETAERADGSLAPIALTTLLTRRRSGWAPWPARIGHDDRARGAIHREIAFPNRCGHRGAEPHARPRRRTLWERPSHRGRHVRKIVASGHIVSSPSAAPPARLMGGFSSPGARRRSSPDLSRLRALMRAFSARRRPGLPVVGRVADVTR